MYKKVIVIIFCLCFFYVQSVKADGIETKGEEITLILTVINEGRSTTDPKKEKLFYYHGQETSSKVIDSPFYKSKDTNNVAAIGPQIIKVGNKSKNLFELLIYVDGKTGVKVVLRPN